MCGVVYASGMCVCAWCVGCVHMSVRVCVHNVSVGVGVVVVINIRYLY